MAHAHLRAGAAAFAAGDANAARASLYNARAAAASDNSRETRERLFADIMALEGRILTASNPAAGAARITESIAFQRRTGREFPLPELYLARGRAYLAAGDPDAALADFEKGIRMLESQRGRVRDYQLRSGVFDDARELFVEAVSASLQFDDLRRAFEYLERGRARTILEELDDTSGALASVPVASIQRSLEEGTILLSYALLPNRVAIFVVDSKDIVVRFSDVPATEAAALARSFVLDMTRRRDVTDKAAALYEMLIEPIHDLVPAAATLAIVPDPELEQVPFSALRDRSANRYLIESHEIVMQPSGAVFAAAQRRASTVRTKDTPSAAIFANPELPQKSAFTSLPGAEAEAASLARLYRERVLHVRRNATVASFTRDAPRHEIVQFSGHAEIDSAEPWKSALILDERLTARDIAAMRFSRTRLIVLGACSTLAPTAGRVESTSSIARAFLMAGVPAVVGALWDVDDTTTAELMTRFHERIARGDAAGAALRDVQRGMIDDRNHHPADWAAFTVLGAGGTSR
jgi:CHAT domain-containing protein